MSEEEEILGAFLLVNDYRILTNEELENVKKAINNLQQENKQLKQQLKDKDEKINKIKDYCLIEREDVNGSKCDDILEILENNKED